MPQIFPFTHVFISRNSARSRRTPPASCSPAPAATPRTLAATGRSCPRDSQTSGWCCRSPPPSAAPAVGRSRPPPPPPSANTTVCRPRSRHPRYRRSRYGRSLRQPPRPPRCPPSRKEPPPPTATATVGHPCRRPLPPSIPRASAPADILAPSLVFQPLPCLSASRFGALISPRCHTRSSFSRVDSGRPHQSAQPCCDPSLLPLVPSLSISVDSRSFAAFPSSVGVSPPRPTPVPVRRRDRVQEGESGLCDDATKAWVWPRRGIFR